MLRFSNRGCELARVDCAAPLFIPKPRFPQAKSQENSGGRSSLMANGYDWESRPLCCSGLFDDGWILRPPHPEKVRSGW